MPPFRAVLDYLSLLKNNKCPEVRISSDPTLKLYGELPCVSAWRVAMKAGDTKRTVLVCQPKLAVL